jgi:hypothetical protein
MPHKGKTDQGQRIRQVKRQAVTMTMPIMMMMMMMTMRILAIILQSGPSADLQLRSGIMGYLWD